MAALEVTTEVTTQDQLPLWLRPAGFSRVTAGRFLANDDHVTKQEVFVQLQRIFTDVNSSLWLLCIKQTGSDERQDDMSA